MTDNIINSTNSQKMSVYCKTCVCKSCEQVTWLEQENAELKAENDKLRNELATYGATGICETCTGKANKQADKYYKTLQEIKAIAECDCGYCKNYRCPRMDNILDLITKAEEE